MAAAAVSEEDKEKGGTDRHTEPTEGDRRDGRQGKDDGTRRGGGGGAGGGRGRRRAGKDGGHSAQEGGGGEGKQWNPVAL